MLNHHPQAGWWGKFSADIGQTLRWEIGPLNLAVRRLANEWQIAFDPKEAVPDETNSWQHNPTAPDLDTLDYAQMERHTARLRGPISHWRVCPEAALNFPHQPACG